MSKPAPRRCSGWKRNGRRWRMPWCGCSAPSARRREKDAAVILSRYLMKAFLARFVALLLGLVIFLQTLDLLATASEVLKGGGPLFESLARYVMLRSPSL